MWTTMKLTIFLSLFLTLGEATSDNGFYNILADVLAHTSPEDMENVNGTDTYGAFKLKGDKVTSIKLENLSVPMENLIPPFEIYAKVLLTEDESSFLFSISAEGTTKLGLQLTPVGPLTVRISLYSDIYPDDQASYLHYMESSEEWTSIIIHVEKKSVTFNINCDHAIINPETEGLKVEFEKIIFPKSSILFLGKFNVVDKKLFRGAIQNLEILPKPDEYGFKQICYGYVLPDSTDKSSGTSTENLSPPDNLVAPFLNPDKIERGDTSIYDYSNSSESDTVETDEDIDTSAKYGDTQTGLKGEKGDKGDQGKSITGLEGSRGPPGDVGLQGPKGNEGSCKCSESVVSGLLRSMPEMRGPRGEPGPRGETGDTGSTGLSGKQGERGLPGEKGEMGQPGSDGKEGIEGPKGAKGEAGQVGRQGAPGPPGPEGRMGVPGPPGPVVYQKTEVAKEVVAAEKGETGPTGPPGPVGPTGPTGPTGELGQKGEKGAQGLKGEKGDETIHWGKNGQPGPRGEKGEIGNPGQNGLPGHNGQHGEKGDKGDRGDKGDTGAPGSPARLSSLLDTNMDPNEYEAIVERFKGDKGNSGETGPRGDRGDMGPIGPVGPPGVDGPKGSIGERGHTGHKGDTGPEGLKGDKGEAGAPGLPGNVPESAISLMKGPKGELGPQGKKGERGLSGHTGKRGPIGPPGSKGSKGEPGQRGPQGGTGSKGKTGDVGPRGEKGETPYINVEELKGEKGDRGESGSPGEPGKAGPPGHCNEINSIGVPGPPGPPGPPGSPGIAITGPKGEPGGIIAKDTMFVYNTDGADSDEDDFYTASTVVFKSTSTLFRRTQLTPPGTLAYVLEEKIMLLRVEEGWQYVAMGSILRTRDSFTSTRRPSTYYTPSDMPLRDAPVEDNYIRLVALNEPYAGNMLTAQNRTGRNAANQECHKQALQARLKSTFVAFLANKVEDLRSLVKSDQDMNVPVVNIHDEVLFDSWSNMFNGSGAALVNGNIYSFNGKNVITESTWETKAVWHGSNLFGIRTPRAFCEEWQSDSARSYGHASSLSGNRLLEQERFSCDKKLIVLCVEATTTAHKKRHNTWSSRRFRRVQRPLDNRIPHS